MELNGNLIDQTMDGFLQMYVHNSYDIGCARHAAGTNPSREIVLS